MDVRLQAAVAAGFVGVNKSRLARDLGISRSTLYEAAARYEAGGVAGLEPRSRRPLSSPGRTSGDVEDLIVRFRKELADEGLDAGARSIYGRLIDHGVLDPPHRSTIWRVLDRRGLVDKNPKKRPRPVWRRFVAGRPNELWQSDSTHGWLADGTVVEIINVIDDHSRLNIASRVVVSTNAEMVWACLQGAIAEFGPPQRLLSDNGPPFIARTVTVNLAAVGISRSFSRPYHPQTNGKVERFHQTQRKWLAEREAHSVAELQALVDEHREFYNRTRRHSAVGDRPPIERYDATAKAAPTGLGTVTAPDKVVTVTTKAGANGAVSVGRFKIGLGMPWAGATLTVIVQGDHAAVFHRDELVRQLVIDPDRVYQPTGKKQTGSRPQPRRT